MNSTTGEFSDMRKSLLDEFYSRGTQSSAKRKPYVPRKVVNIRPLNLDGIKKELEENLKEDESQSVVNSEKCNENGPEKVQINLAEFEEKDATELKPTCEEEILKDISNNVRTDRNKTEIKNTYRNMLEDKENGIDVKSSKNVIIEVKENNMRCGQKNDSFDLDFTALSISTPVKKNEISFVTPSANKNLRVTKLEQTSREQFGGFVTPRANNIVSVVPPSLVKQTSLRTPINSSGHKLSKNVLMLSKNVINTHPLAALAEEGSVKEEHQSTPRENNFKIIKVNTVEYIVLNMLGKGGSSEVYQCYNVGNQRHVAIKCVSLQNSASASGYINEVKLLHQLQKCDKIIKMYDYEILESQKKLLVVLEKGGEDLSAILKQLATQTSHIPMYMLLFYWMEMLYAVKQIHSHGVIHSDLKPSNFLKADGGLKLIDFGIASSVQNDMTSVIKTTPEGSCNYISPEALNNDSSTSGGSQSSNPRYKLHYKSDVWSLGCILYQLVYRRTPFQHISQLWPKLAAILNPNHKIDYPDAQWVSPKIILTIQKCLQYNIKSRPSVDELISEYDTILHNI